MNLLRFIPIKLTFFLIVGILIGYYFNITIVIAAALAVFPISILGVLFFSKKNSNAIAFNIAALISVVTIGILALSYSQPKNRFNHYTKTDFKDASLWNLKVTEVLKPTTFSNRYIVTIKRKNNQRFTGKLIVSTSKDSLQKPFRIDDELFVYAIVSEIKEPLNPHQFSYANYLEKLGIYHEIRLKQNSIVLSKNPETTIYGQAALTRNHIISKLEDANFGADELAVIKALLLGQRNDISESTYTNYKNAGAVHILAVSGLHIGVLLWLLQFLLRPIERLPNGKTIKLLLIIILLWGFAFIAGLSASIIRAVTMFSFVAYALYLNRPSNTFNILALSMFFILLVINPMLIFQVGFQMSYAAVLAIVWIYPLLQKFWLPKNIVVRKVWQLLSVSAAAQLGVLPISLFYFHQFPGLFFISNLLIIPFLEVILGMGILVILLSLSNTLFPFIASSYNNLIKLMNTVIGWVAKQETFIFKSISFDSVQLLLSYILIISLVLLLSKTTFKKWIVFLSAVISLQVWMFYVSHQNNQKKEFIVFNQNRNTILLYREGDKVSVINGANNDYGQKILTDYCIGERINHVHKVALKNSYSIHDKKLIVIDSMGIYSTKITPPDFLLLTQSPKIHLDRLIDSIQPRHIIADGSNYSSYVKRWKETCAKRKLPFHHTGEKGAFIFKN